MSSQLQSPQKQDWDTNFGWWADKPERAARPGTVMKSHRLPPQKADRVWAEAALIVGLAVSLVLSLVSLAIR